ncbi:molybdate ABC transporter substrate-binding protein [Planomonospora sp. ID82291]|uniref:molybdate ABC transporter substrate-binding protein n=1 Tax=Planomonospora sp. ID82291 TaxID=2738136 RepID=UPI0027DB16D6|nr:molybdate ABC transporter substrate-binding protein [Planomonospora sp. ID82291]
MGHRNLRATALAVLALLAGSAGCSSSEGAERTVTVFAAASLTEVFTGLGADFEAANPGTDVRFNFGSSATLAQQIVQGAPADVFAAASPATMKTVTDASLADAPAVFARNRLQIAVPAGDPGRIGGLADLADPRTKVALCAPQVPCGAAAAKALAAAGVKVTPVTLEQDVKATLTKLVLGEVDAALVYRTDVRAAKGRSGRPSGSPAADSSAGPSAGGVEGVDFPEAGQAVNDYPIAVLRPAPAGDLARRFTDLVLSRRGRDALAAAGFEVP